MFEIPVESGRVVIIARRRLPRVPMRDACYLSNEPVGYGKLTLAVAYEKVPGHPGTLEAAGFFVGHSEGAQALLAQASVSSVALFAHAPRILIADHAFVYQKTSGETDEGSRALRACEGARRLGTFRADSLDVGGCLRTGRRRCTYEIRPVAGGIAGQLRHVEEDDLGEEACN